MAKKVETTHRRRGGVVVKSVVPESIAAQCGIQQGDTIHSINEIVIPDSLSYSFNIRQFEMNIVIEKADGEHWELEIENDPDVDFGVALEEDPIMLCRNKCVFCFVDQNPKGYRRSLLIKDEDIRLSFMYGNYSTLSSTDAAEEARIIRERISPLYVSVHATDPETRVFMLKSKKQGDILARLSRFAAAGIDFHAQIVLCPGINDGAILEKTFHELAGLHPHCLSIAVVPLGITAHRAGLTQLEPVTDAYCEETIDFCEPFRARFKEELGYPLIFLGDEFFIRAKRPIPPAHHYRDFPQMENGIGMVRRFEDGVSEDMEAATLPEGLSGTLVTGTLFGDALKEQAARINRRWNTNLRVAAIRNDSFGADLINVAGLVHAKDIIAQLMVEDLGDFVVIPQVMLKDPAEDPIFIDDLYPRHIARALNVPIVGTGNGADDLLRVLTDWRGHLLALPEDKHIRRGVLAETA